MNLDPFQLTSQKSEEEEYKLYRDICALLQGKDCEMIASALSIALADAIVQLIIAGRSNEANLDRSFASLKEYVTAVVATKRKGQN